MRFIYDAEKFPTNTHKQGALIHRHRSRVQRPVKLIVSSLAIFLGVAWILPAFSEFDLRRDHISELALGHLGFLQTIAFLSFAFGTIGVAYQVWRIGITPNAFAGALMIGGFGVSGIVAAIVPTDRIDAAVDLMSLSLPGAIHTGAGMLGLVSIIIGMFILTISSPGEIFARPCPRWRLVIPVAATVMMIAQMLTSFSGLIQRVLYTTLLLWLISLAEKIRYCEISRSGNK